MTGEILRVILLGLQLGFVALLYLVIGIAGLGIVAFWRHSSQALYLVLMRFAGSLLRDLRSAE